MNDRLGTNASGSACAQLKAATQDLHDLLDHQSAMRRFVAPDLQWAEYARLLQRMGRCYGAMERALEPFARAHGETPVWLDPAVFRRGGDIALDLEIAWTRARERNIGDASGAPRHEASHATTLQIDTAAQAAGCMYVLGGASMGARVIARALRKHLGDDVTPALHFFGAGDQAGAPSFSDLRIALDQELRTPQAIGAALTTARQAFTVFIDEFGR